MAILRNPTKNRFTNINNRPLRDKNLSLKARGLLASMLSLPDNWEFSENGLVAIFPKDGQTSIRSGIKELEDSGYLIRERSRDEHGRLSKVSWIISDYPHFENPNLDNPNLDNPNLEKQPQLNTKESNTNKRNTKESNTEVFDWLDWKASSDLSPRMKAKVDDWLEYKKERRQSYKPMGLKTLLTQISSKVSVYGEDAVIKAIDLSMSSNYSGIVFDRLEKPTKSCEAYVYDDGFETSNPFKAMAHEEGLI